MTATTATSGTHRWTVVTAALLTLAALPAFASRIALASERIALSYNEGWNALHADRLRQGLALYPSADGLIVNNYPPVSFHLVTLLGGDGDLVRVLRALALLGLVGTIVLSALTVTRLGGSRAAGWLAGALLFATFSIHLGEYVAMADPSLVAHGLMAVAMYIAVRWWESDRMLRLALVFQLIAGMTKSNLVAFPLAMALALLLENRSRALKLIAVGVPLGMLALALLRLGYGADAIRSILATRPSQLATALRKAWVLLPPMAIPIVGGLMGGIAVFRRPVERLFVIYLVLGLATGFYFSGAAGVNMNVYFDAVIASAVLVGLLASRLATATAPRWLVYAPLVLGLSLARPAWWSWSDSWGILRGGRLAQRAADTAEDVRVLAASSGPVACEMLSLCYWAGRGFEMDFFNAVQLYRTGRAGSDNIHARVASGRYGMLQVIKVTPYRFGGPPADSTDVLADYREERRSTNGVILVRRTR